MVCELLCELLCDLYDSSFLRRSYRYLWISLDQLKRMRLHRSSQFWSTSTYRRTVRDDRLLKRMIHVYNRWLCSASSGSIDRGLDKMKDLEIVFSYHQDSKHHPERYAKGPGYMDWANQPNPFREYRGAKSLIRLDLTDTNATSPVMPEVLAGSIPARSMNAMGIAQLFRDSMSLSAWKSHKSSRWALRCNPSSGNLHPTEAFLICGPIDGLTQTPIIAHYRPKEHALEVRAELPLSLWKNLGLGEAILVGLSSIHWREAWKYGERAFRYCQHDIGHAIEAIEIAAGCLGWSTSLLDQESTYSDMLSVFGLKDAQPGMPQPASSHEEPDCLILISQSGKPSIDTSQVILELSKACNTATSWHGEPNILSARQVPWKRIDEITYATRKDAPTQYLRSHLETTRSGAFPSSTAVPVRKMIHQRRSAQDFVPDHEPKMTAEQFYSFLTSCQAQFPCLPWDPCVHLGIMIHQVDGLEPGLYFFCRNEKHLSELRLAIDKDYIWKKPVSCPGDLHFFQLTAGNARTVAKTISCHQEIAGDSSFALGMVARFEDEINKYGAWFYRRLFWETGMIGQRLYLQAEGCGFRGTGIGCFFDDLFHSVLGLQDYKFQSLYHFTVGYPTVDERLVTLPPYLHRADVDRRTSTPS